MDDHEGDIPTLERKELVSLDELLEKARVMLREVIDDSEETYNFLAEEIDKAPDIHSDVYISGKIYIHPARLKLNQLISSVDSQQRAFLESVRNPIYDGFDLSDIKDKTETYRKIIRAYIVLALPDELIPGIDENDINNQKKLKLLSALERAFRIPFEDYDSASDDDLSSFFILRI